MNEAAARMQGIVESRNEKRKEKKNGRNKCSGNNRFYVVNYIVRLTHNKINTHSV
jgi:hypothetical protein